MGARSKWLSSLGRDEANDGQLLPPWSPERWSTPPDGPVVVSPAVRSAAELAARPGSSPAPEAVPPASAA